MMKHVDAMEKSNDRRLSLSQRIARLVRERGWTQKAFAEAAHLNRLTARNIMTQPSVRLRGDTLRACATALGFTVEELVEAPLPELLRRLRGPKAPVPRDEILAQQPELLAWMEANPDRAAQLGPTDVDELLSLQGTGGPLTHEGVCYFIDRLERKRLLLTQVEMIAGTDYLPLLEQMVGLIMDRIDVQRSPGRTRSAAANGPLSSG